MPLEIIRNDITKVRADAIINTANPNVAVGDGVDSAVYAAAGRDLLLAERAKIGPLRPGECAVTPAFALPAKYIIHTVGPAWEGGDKGEVETVAKCYRNSLEKAKELNCESAAFPLISAGTYGFPKDVALKTAVSEISGFLFGCDMTVYLVVYDKKSFEVSGKAFSEIKSYIDESDVVIREHRRTELGGNALRQPRNVYSESFGLFPDEASETAPYASAQPADGTLRPQRSFSVESPASSSAAKKRRAGIFSSIVGRDKPEKKTVGSIPPSAVPVPVPNKSIDDVIKEKDDTFQQYLLRIIDRKGLTDPEVYKKANIDRKHFSKIRSNVNYNPSKKTALALAVALELNLDETRDLLLKAGMALTRSSIFDIIMEYCIEHRMTDIHEINCILFEYGQPTLGAEQ
ncbi:MAG: macro domain-containing protein [Clostridia bacterium]|nr:macro domain-containing protein [Clostridia bacterium]